MKKKILMVAMVATLVLGATGGAAAVTPANSISANYHSTSSNTVVVYYGNMSQRGGRATAVAADSIAAHNNATIIQVSSSSLSPQVIETLSQQIKNGGLRKAIIVGENQTKADAVATAVSQIGAKTGGSTTKLSVQNEISGSSANDVLKEAAIQGWSSSNTMFVGGTTQAQTRREAILQADSGIRGLPVMADGSGYNTINNTASVLGVSKIYVGPDVSSALKSKFTNHGYTVNSTPGGVDLSQSNSNISAAYTANNTADVDVAPPSLTYVSSQVGSGTNSSLLTTASATSVGGSVKTKLQNLGNDSQVYVLGDSNDLGDTPFSTIAHNAPNNTTRISRTQGITQMSLRTELLTSGYKYGVLTSYVSHSGQTYNVHVTNIGYSTINKVGNESATLKWNGDGGSVQSSTPNGSNVNGNYVIHVKKRIDPGTTRTVNVTASSLSNGGTPEIHYYLGSSGGFIGTSSYFTLFLNSVQKLPGWLKTQVSNILKLLPGVNSPSTPFIIAAIVASVVAVYAIIKLLQIAMSNNTRILNK